MLTAHQRIAWARRWPGYTLKIEGAPRWVFTVAAPDGDRAGGFRLAGYLVPFLQGREENTQKTGDKPALRAAKEILDMLDAA
jgi:hypothetical protein